MSNDRRLSQRFVIQDMRRYFNVQEYNTNNNKTHTKIHAKCSIKTGYILVN